MREVLWGLGGVASAMVAILFVRHWRRSGDRFFAFFTGAFAALALNNLLLTFISGNDEATPYVYLVRLIAFLLIIAAVVDKNRPAPAPDGEPDWIADGDDDEHAPAAGMLYRAP
jgi:hypothetical protein